jgi:hypothetical protein
VSNTLDQFESSLVDASRALHRAGGARTRDSAHRRATGESTRAAAEEAARAGWTARVRWGLGRRRWRVVAGVLAVGVLSAAGSTLFGPRGNPRTIASIQCGATYVDSVTGDPIRDCETLWPSIYHHPAPHLTAWVAASGGAVVVVPTGVVPASDGVFHWKRLPAGFAQDRAAVELGDELADIAGGLAARPCWSASAAATLVDSTLRADGLTSWRVEVKAEPSEAKGADAHATCLTVAPIVQGESDSVRLVERRVPAPHNGTFMTQSAALRQAHVVALERDVNKELSASGARCASIARAAALWRAGARAAGLAASEYVLFTQAPGAAVSAGCARITVVAPGGGGAYHVYAARLP